MSRPKLFLLILLFALGLAVRLYRFDQPIADWHAWRQTDTSAVSKFLVRDGFDILHPRFYDLSNVPSGIHENPQGYRFVEFPIYNLLQASFFEIFGVLTIEEWGRLVTIFSSLSSAIFIYLLVKKYLNDTAGIFAAGFFLFIPYNIFFGRTVLPDSTTVTTTLCAIYFFDRWLETNSKFKIQNSKLRLESQAFFILSIVFAVSSLLLQPFSAFFFIPMLFLSFEKYGLNFLKKKELWLFLIISITPIALWRLWMLQYPGGIPQSGWLLNGNNIRFKGAFFQWIFAERISRMILGFWGLSLLILGILLKLPKKTYLFFASFLASSLLYLVVVATGNVQHDYYQILIMPTIAIYLGLGAYYLWENKANINRYVSLTILFVSVVFMLMFGWYNVRAFYNIDHPEIIRAGKAIDDLIPKDARVLVPASGGDTTALYFMDRQGWSSFTRPLPELIKLGADYLIIINPTKQDYNLGEKYGLIASSPDFVLFNLRQSP